MTFDLLSMAELSLSAAVVVSGFAVLFGRSRREQIVIGMVMALWFASVLAAGATYLLYDDGGPGVPGLAVAVVLPIVLMSWAGFGSVWGRERLRSAPLPGLAGIQAVRILGVSFVLLYAAGRLPAPFAPVAGWGDIAIGATALPMALWVSRGVTTGAFIGWNAIGLLDLVAAVGLGAMSSPGAIRVFTTEPGSEIMATLPWIIIPCFLVPALAFAHLIVFWRLLQPEASVQAISHERYAR